MRRNTPNSHFAVVALTVSALLLLSFGACTDDDPDAGAADSNTSDSAGDVADLSVDDQLAAAVQATRLRAVIDQLASDEWGGRASGSAGHASARAFLISEMEAIGLQPMGTDGYIQRFESDEFRTRQVLDDNDAVVDINTTVGNNLVGMLPGSSAPDEYIVLMAHYDHLGVNGDGEVFNGALDDAGGVSAVLEVARVLTETDTSTARSILFLLTDAEETGLLGAEAWVADPTVPLDDVVMAISADPMGRAMLSDFNFILVSGLERSPELAAVWPLDEHEPADTVAAIDRSLIPSLFASDQDAFHEVGIPAIWYLNTGYSFYHQIGDEADTIDYRVLRDATRYLARVVRQLGDDSTQYSYAVPDTFSIENAAQSAAILEGILGSPQLTDSERDTGNELLAEAEAVVASGDWDAAGGAVGLFLRTATFALFQLSAAHPGPIPPPFPE